MGTNFKTFSWHYGDKTLIHLWCMLLTYMPVSAVYHTWASNAKLSQKSYTLGWNLIFFTPLLITTLWRLGNAYGFPTLHILPVVYSFFLALYYYGLSKQGMYFESLLWSFLVLMVIIPLRNYLPKMQNRRIRRLPDLIKEQQLQQKSQQTTIIK